MSKSKRRFRSAAQIRKIVAELKDSGLSHREFAVGHNIPLSTLSSWLGKHRRATTADNCQREVIPVGTISRPPSRLEIEFPGGEVLRIGVGCRSEDLRCVLAELRRC